MTDHPPLGWCCINEVLAAVFSRAALAFGSEARVKMTNAAKLETLTDLDSPDELEALARVRAASHDLHEMEDILNALAGRLKGAPVNILTAEILQPLVQLHEKIIRNSGRACALLTRPDKGPSQGPVRRALRLVRPAL